ncbi:ribonuclease PH [Tepidiforma thermophila]|uniref:Ribonuclease PH n=1 Tax=Tepidiforma thermophila (strain KCTC 52669 / CGMCC 1.13589 / G233) TaxID=2761530 RepID=A0A2A9HHX4_TEPT2|nr:ribonuclease PH [Tepidiforma thermophila]PFG74700.1 RNAse PH [Tepidiforma thermophila]
MTTRIDGRAPDELRPVHLATNVLDFAEGSCLVEFGRTRVLCAASVEDRQPPFLRNTQSGWVTAEYAMLPRATHTRSQREVERGRPGGRTQEIQRLIGRSLRGVVDLELLGPRTITLDCDVIQADGGTRTASITGAYVALRLAIRKLAAAGLVSEACILSPVAAVSVGIVGGVPMLDLCYEEDSTAEVDFNVVMTGEDAFVEVQGTAEGKPFSRAAMDALLDLARHGIGQLFAKQQEALAAAQPT